MPAPRPARKVAAVAEGPDGRLLEALGLARRAGRLAVGTRAVREAAETGELALAVVAADAGENALGRLGPVLEGDAPSVRVADRRALGQALGRGPVVAVGVTDPGLAGKIRRLAGGAASDAGRTPRTDGPYEPEGEAAGGPGGGAETSAIHVS